MPVLCALRYTLSRVGSPILVGAMLALILSAGMAWAQAPSNWPTRPVRVIVNYAPGGSTDNATRPFMARMSQVLGQQFVIENKPGASGAVGVEAGTKSAPDGYTFFATPVATLAILPNARKSAYDSFKDMVPVAHYADSTLVIAVHPSVPAKSLQELVAYAKTVPGKLNFGSSGLGTLTQMICEQLKLSGGIDILHVPYRGGAESLSDFLGGITQIFSEGNVLPHVQAGKARLLAVVDSQRHPDFPDVPMFKEIFPEADILNWFGLFAPAGTPAPIVERMATEMNKIALEPEIQAHMLRLALRATTGTPAQLGALLRKDFDRYVKIIKQLDLRLD
ncbi:MAG: tripartite tricarboxylate transporter substrate binding protein [Acetobacteraceae bacterium]|nr:tripartite tricarboxylate transporter substrate binding protein [Acetobacteraceae bacterium]